MRAAVVRKTRTTRTPTAKPRRPTAGLPVCALDALDLEICVVDAAGRVLEWNRRLAARVAPRASVVGRPIEDAVARFTRPEWGVDWAARVRDEVLSRGQAVEVRRYPQRSRQNELLLYDMRAEPIRDPAGAVTGAVIALRDVTELARRESDTLRREKADELAHLGASVAHEIRNPLNSIGMNAQLLREGIAKVGGHPDLVETADLIAQEIRRLNGVVTSFLTYARHPEARLRPDDPNAALRQVVRLLAPEAARAGVRVTLDLAPLPVMPIDREQLTQAIYNLVQNGLQEMQGGGVLTLATRLVRDWALIEVCDTGRGVPPDERERIFELFHTTREGGTGLGLPIARRIVEAHGGRITADDAPEGGARFRIHLPVEATGVRSPDGPDGAAGPA